MDRQARAHTGLFTEYADARFSPCRRYRYLLWRQWDESRPTALFLMLNPSTADETANDPTVERCQRRAAAMSFGGLLVANICALRSTDPSALYGHDDPIGPENDQAILAAAAKAGVVVCAWGTHGALRGRGAAVLGMLGAAGVQSMCLGMNQDGSPKHPLYVPYSASVRQLPPA